MRRIGLILSMKGFLQKMNSCGINCMKLLVLFHGSSWQRAHQHSAIWFSSSVWGRMLLTAGVSDVSTFRFNFHNASNWDVFLGCRRVLVQHTTATSATLVAQVLSCCVICSIYHAMYNFLHLVAFGLDYDTHKNA